MSRLRMGYGMGALVMPTETMPGVTGYMTLVIASGTTGALSYAVLAGPAQALQIWEQSAVGGTFSEITQDQATGGSTTVNGLASNGNYTFYLLPMDGSNNVYQSVEQLSVMPAQPGIFVSPSTPSTVVSSLQAQYPGLPVYGTQSQIGAAAAVVSGFSIGDWIETNPLEAAGIGLVGIVLLKTLLK